MGFFSFLGRVLFASLFILSAWQMFNEFGEDGGPAAKEWAPKIAAFQKFLDSKFENGKLDIDVRQVVAVSMVLKGLGGLLFVFGSSIGAYILLCYLLYAAPVLHDFYNYEYNEPKFFSHLEEFLQCVALFGALLYFLGMKSSLARKLKRKAFAPKAKAA